MSKCKNAAATSSATSLENGLHMLLRVLVGRLQVMQFLLQILDFSLDILCLFGLTLLDVLGRGENEPGASRTKGLAEACSGYWYMLVFAEGR